MDIQFDLSFITFDRGNSLDNQIKVSKFANSYKELIEMADDYSIEVLENNDLSLYFNYDSNVNFFNNKWILEIDMLDTLPEACFTEEELLDKNYPVFLPSANIRPLYLDSRSVIESTDGVIYPMLIPGSYKVKVSCNDKVYFCFLKVLPLRLDENQLEIMRKDIESYIVGLSLKLKKDSNINIEKYNSNNILYIINLFMQNENHLNNMINRIIKFPKYYIKKLYRFEDINKVKKTNSKTIQYKQKRTDMHNKLLGYHNIVQYNIKENQLIKHIVRTLISNIQNSIKFLHENIEREKLALISDSNYGSNNEKEIKYLQRMKVIDENIDIISKLTTLLNNSNKLISTDWLVDVECSSYIDEPMLLAKNHNYRNLYKFYLQLKSNSFIKMEPMKNYNYYWKESSKLYEIWCFLKINESLLKSKFTLKPISGWIYDYTKNSRDSMIIPFLDPNTVIVYENNSNLKLKLYYDSTILLQEKTTFENPIFSVEQNNRPDFRIDIYKDDLYINTIIGDFKYRSYASLGNINKYLANKPSAYKQLLAYSQIKTMYKHNNIKNLRSSEAAFETWVIYPEKSTENIKRQNTFDSATNIRRIELSPGKEERINDFIMLIENVVNSI